MKNLILRHRVSYVFRGTTLGSSYLPCLPISGTWNTHLSQDLDC